MQKNEIRYFKYERVEHQCRDCPNKRLEKKKVARVANPQKTQ